MPGTPPTLSWGSGPARWSRPTRSATPGSRAPSAPTRSTSGSNATPTRRRRPLHRGDGVRRHPAGGELLLHPRPPERLHGVDRAHRGAQRGGDGLRQRGAFARDERDPLHRSGARLRGELHARAHGIGKGHPREEVAPMCPVRTVSADFARRLAPLSGRGVPCPGMPAWPGAGLSPARALTLAALYPLRTPRVLVLAAPPSEPPPSPQLDPLALDEADHRDLLLKPLAAALPRSEPMRRVALEEAIRDLGSE